MNFIKEYVLSYFPSYRGNNKIKEYFSSPYNNAISKLTEEGYALNKEFKNLCNTYQMTYTLNKDESLFIDQITTEYIQNHAKITLDKKNPLEYELFINIARLFIKLYKESLQHLDLKYESNVLKTNYNLLEKELRKMRPIYEAVAIRIFVKKLLEDLIKKNINDIYLINYTPEITVLNNYLKCLEMYYISERGHKKNIQKEIKKLITDIESSKNNEKKNSKSPKIQYKNENKEIFKVMKVLFVIKTYCNTVIHPKSIINFNINEYIYNNNQCCYSIDNDINNEEDQEGYKTCETNKIKNSLYFPVSKVVEFIAYGKDTSVLLLKLKNLSKKIKNKMEITINKIKQVDFQEKEANYYIHRLKSIQDEIDTTLKNLVLSENTELFNPDPDKVKNIIKFLNNNQLSLENIPLSVAKGDMDEERNIIKLNDIFYNLKDIYKRIKLNLTLKQNLDLINLKNQLIPVFKDLETIEEINNNLDKINFNDDLTKINEEINAIDKQLFIFERDRFFTEISQEKFKEIIENEFSFVDVSGKEITDFYFFIFLLKMGLYDEISYKCKESIV